MRRNHKISGSVLLAGLVLLSGCGGTMNATRFVNPGFDFGFVERAAVLPFENFSTDRDAGPRATRLMSTELLASGAVDVVEPGEVRAALARLAAARPGSGVAPNTEEIISLGKALRVQALILGSVTQSEMIRSGSIGIPVVTLDARMVETETGTTVWATTHTVKGGHFGARVLGTGGKPISETTRRCVRRLVRALVK